MPQSLVKIYLHIIFSTKDRQPFIKPEIEDELHRYMAGILKSINTSTTHISQNRYRLQKHANTQKKSKMFALLTRCK